MSVAIRLFATCLLLCSLSISAAENWPRFRGPNGSGVSEAKTIPVTFTERDFNWEVALPGTGHSSPVVWGERLFVTSADIQADVRYLLCIDTDRGEILWRKEFPFTEYKKHKQNSYASNSPAVDAERVYVLWQTPTASAITAFTHQGEQLWQTPLGPFKTGQGSATSPIVYDGAVILANDQKGPSFLIALEADTGKVRWKIDRQSDRAMFSTPCIFEPRGRSAEAVFTDLHHGMTGVDVKTGAVNWELDVFDMPAARALGSPIVWKDLVLGTCGFVTAKKAVVAIRPSEDSGKPSAEVAYTIERSVPHVPTAIAYGEHVFLWNDGGIVTCIKGATGQKVWQARVDGTYSASPVCVDGKLYSVNADGVVSVIAAADKFKLLGKSRLGEISRATPAVAGGRIYFRTLSHVISLGGKMR